MREFWNILFTFPSKRKYYKIKPLPQVISSLYTMQFIYIKDKDKEFVDQKHINISNTIQDKYFTN